MTAYSWILKQIIADQTELIESILNIKNEFIEFSNNTFYYSEETGETFKTIECHKKRIRDIENSILENEKELKNIFKNKIIEKDFKIEKVIRNRIQNLTNEIDLNEHKLSELKVVSEINKVNLKWLLINSENLYNLLKEIKQPTAKSCENYWWGVEEEPNEEITKIFNVFKKIIFFKNTKEEYIINYISNILLHKNDESEIFNNPNIPYWRNNVDDPFISDCFKKLYYVIPQGFPNTTDEIEGISFMIKYDENNN